MALVVEDGNPIWGKPNANAFDSLANVKARWTALGRDFSSYSDAQIEAAIIRATAWLSESFTWKGWRRHGRNSREGYQALAWPRYGVYDREGSYVDDEEIPIEIRWATAEAAWHELQEPESLNPAYTPHGREKKLRAGPVEIEYDLSRQDATGARPVLLAVTDLVAEFLNTATGSGSRYSSLAVRG